ncbi:kinase-like domain-containing protein [Xylaria curta]|nr:kinase-like domain-containing protein [Xylaria curta]
MYCNLLYQLYQWIREFNSSIIPTTTSPLSTWLPTSSHFAPSSSIQDLPDEDFQRHLRSYYQYVRGVYQEYEKRRFEVIPERRKGNPEKFSLRKQDVLDMDMWIRKRGVSLDQRNHEANTEAIQKNDAKKVKNVTSKAFRDFERYRASIAGDVAHQGYGEGAWKAMETLMKLDGIDPPRACLLLSVAFPEIVPFCSEALCTQIRNMKNDQLGMKMGEDDFKHFFKKVEEIRQKRNVTSIDIEKVAYVLQCNADVEDLRRSWIKRDLWKDAGPGVRGSYGRVFKVKQTSDMGIVDHVGSIAIKSMSTMDGLKRLRHEVLTEIMISSRLTQASREHFVQLLGWNGDEENDRYYIAMEYVAYGDLEDNLMYPKEGWVWTESHMKTVAEQILQGLQFMHEALIAHRDLKPQNVLVASLRQKLRVKIADFGVSKRLSERGTTLLKTSTGTTGYKAPEVVKNWNTGTSTSIYRYSYNVDVWSLGCIVYRMAHGSGLFTEDSELADDDWLNKRVNSIKHTLEQKSAQNINISKSGIKFVVDLIQIDPDTRPKARRAMKLLRRWTVDQRG